jgi:hypothetical protein
MALSFIFTHHLKHFMLLNCAMSSPILLCRLSSLLSDDRMLRDHVAGMRTIEVSFSLHAPADPLFGNQANRLQTRSGHHNTLTLTNTHPALPFSVASESDIYPINAGRLGMFSRQFWHTSGNGQDRKGKGRENGMGARHTGVPVKGRGRGKAGFGMWIGGILHSVARLSIPTWTTRTHTFSTDTQSPNAQLENFIAEK